MLMTRVRIAGGTQKFGQIIRTFTLIAFSNLTSKPTHQLGTADIIFFLSKHAFDFQHLLAVAATVLLDDHDPTVFVVLMMCEKLIERVGINREFGTDLMGPELAQKSDSRRSKTPRVEARNQNVTLGKLKSVGSPNPVTDDSSGLVAARTRHRTQYFCYHSR